MRVPTNEKVDQQYFHRTAAKAKAINLGARIFRGGIRF